MEVTWMKADSRLRVEQLSPSALAYLGDAVYELLFALIFCCRLDELLTITI